MAVKNRIKDCKIIAYAHRRETLNAARELGAIDEGYDQPQAAVRGAELVILCTPVSMISPLLEQIGPVLEDGAVATDVGSTKRSIVAAGEKACSSRGHFVGSHPMAGSEKRGIRHARADLFEGAVCMTTPTERTDPAALGKVEKFWETLGMRVRRISPEDHDRLLADVSHLPHAVAAALVSMQDPEALGLCGKGFLDMTRIAGGEAGLWRDILLDNRDNVRMGIQKLIQMLGGLNGLLEPDRADELSRWLDAAAQQRQRLSSEVISNREGFTPSP